MTPVDELASRQRRIAEKLAAARRAQRRRLAVGWLALALVPLGIISAGTLAVAHRAGHAAARDTGQLGPEGMPVQTGPPLARSPQRPIRTTRPRYTANSVYG